MHRSMLRLTIIALVFLAALPATAGASRSSISSALSATTKPSRTGQIGKVSYVYRGVSVQPPRGQWKKGKKKMPLYNQYGMQTIANQRASVRFGDGTTLHVNQRTALVLRSPSLTYVARGEVAQVLQPGSNHRVQTATAVAAAIGTTFDVKAAKSKTTFIVLEGALRVHNSRGSVLVKTDQATDVYPNQRPTPPRQVDAAAEVAWTTSMPQPKLGQNLALDANGGRVVANSSQRSGGEATLLDDGRLDTAWQTAPGATSNQWVKIGFGGTKIFLVTGILIDPVAGGNVPAGTALKDFEIRYSLNSTDDKDFVTLMTGSLKATKGFVAFPVRPVRVRYLELLAKSNGGGADSVSVAELEVVGLPDTAHIFNQPYGIAIDPQGNVDVAELAFGVIQRMSPEGKLLATLGASGRGPGRLGSLNGIAVDDAGNIYAADGAVHRIVKLSPSGTALLEWGSSGSGPGQFATPNGVATDAQGNVYVTDSNNSRVEKFSSTGQFLAEFGGRGTKPGQFAYGPSAIALDPQGNMYITADGDHVVKFSPSGAQLARWGTGGKGTNQFNGALGIALDAQGNIYVADSQNTRIAKLSSTGQWLTSWPTPGDKPGLAVRPGYLAVDAKGYVYVTSGAHGGVVQKYSPTGQLLATWR